MKKLMLIGITALALGCASQIHNTRTTVQIPTPTATVQIAEPAAAVQVYETTAKGQVLETTTPAQIGETTAVGQVYETTATGQVREKTTTGQIPEVTTKAQIGETAAARQVYETTATGQVIEKTTTGQILETISLEQRVSSNISAGTELIRKKDYDNAHWAFYEALFKIQRQPELFSNSTINDVIDKFDFSFHEQIATTIAIAIGNDKALTNSIVSILEFSNYRDRLTGSFGNRLSRDDAYMREDAYNTLTLQNYVVLANLLKSETLPPKEEKYALYRSNLAYLKLCLSIGFKQTKNLYFMMPVVSLMKQYPKPSDGWELEFLMSVNGVCKVYDLILAKLLSVETDEATRVLHKRYFSAFDHFVSAVRPTLGPLRERSNLLVGLVEKYMDRIWLQHAVINLYLAPKQEPIRKDSPISFDTG
jgi:hypothetical protein